MEIIENLKIMMNKILKELRVLSSCERFQKKLSTDMFAL